MDGRRAGRVGVIAALAAVAAIGVGGERWASAGDEGGGAVPLAESTPSVIVPLAPARILDTRFGTGAPQGRVAPGSTLTLQVTGVGGVPAEATGVVLNLTATVSDGAGYVTAYPAGGSQPNASVINYSAGEDVANMVTAQLGAGGALAIFNDQANVHLVADVAGYLVPGSGGIGPQGPQGPAGPAGPGATVIVNQPVTGTQVLGIYAGFTLSAFCNAGNIGLSFDSVADGQIRISGVRERFDGTAPEQLFMASAGGTLGPNSTTGALLLDVVIDAAGTVSAVELSVRYGAPCFVWGTIIPAA